MRRTVVAVIVSAVAVALAASPAQAAPAPFGHACSTQSDGTRFCPTTDGGAGRNARRRAVLRRRPARRRRDAAAQRQRPVPDDRDAARLRRRQDRLRVDRPDRRRLDHLPLQQRLLRPGRATRWSTTRREGSATPAAAARPPITPAPAPRATSASPTPATRRATRSTCSACSPTRGSPSRARSASPASPTAVARASSSPTCATGSASPTARFAPWRSPQGKPLSIAAAWPRWPWSDLVDALLPNGRFLDSEVAPQGQSLDPSGSRSQSYVSGLYALGKSSGYYCGDAPASSPCTDPDADLTTDFALVNAGEPPRRGEAPPGRDLRPPPGLRPVRLARAAPDRERLDRRPVPARAGAPRLQPGARRSSGQPPVRRPRPQPRLQQADGNRAFNEQGACLLRPLPARVPRRPGAGLGHRLHPDLSGEHPRWRPLHGPSYGRPSTPGHHLRLGRDPARHRGRRSARARSSIRSAAPATPARRSRLGRAGDTPSTIPTTAGFTLLGLPTVTATIHTTGLRRARLEALRRRAERRRAPGQPRRLPPDRKPERAGDVPAARQRLPLPAGAHGQARPAGQRRPVPARQQQPGLLGGGLAADREPSNRRRLTAALHSAGPAV